MSRKEEWEEWQTIKRKIEEKERKSKPREQIKE